MRNIVEILLSSDKCEKIYGNWTCSSCSHSWQKRYNKKELEEWLRKPSNDDVEDFFTKDCRKCGNEKMLDIFCLHMLRPGARKKTLKIEIIFRLEWNKYYRVFGSWQCQNCNREWASAHTYISLQKFIEGSKLEEEDYYVQKCKTKKCRNEGIITQYKPLNKSLGGFVEKKPHIAKLCAKCMGGNLCVL
ncbi:6127_t:CDS:2 [Ambispora gerdemannii]|uniref:6127_t:CDS:1 n=1 Tax=Ambispora gerdemannii TaxID=144530 RepID=A0A9N8VGX4_9GLOM|nr:6127_t:CDS:2 [Ambispora gerdemannii]